MKRNFIFAAALLLSFVSCKPESYPDIRYTNTQNESVAFRTAENHSQKIELAANESRYLSSNVYGRTQIASIETPLFIWEYNGHDVYDIHLIKKGVALEIRNYTMEKVIVKEKNGYISYDGTWSVEAELGPRNEKKFFNVDLKLYTDKPVWIMDPQKRFELKRIMVNGQIDKYILGIEPPGDDEEWENL